MHTASSPLDSSFRLCSSDANKFSIEAAGWQSVWRWMRSTTTTGSLHSNYFRSDRCRCVGSMVWSSMVLSGPGGGRLLAVQGWVRTGVIDFLQRYHHNLLAQMYENHFCKPFPSDAYLATLPWSVIGTDILALSISNPTSAPEPQLSIIAPATYPGQQERVCRPFAAPGVWACR